MANLSAAISNEMLSTNQNQQGDGVAVFHVDTPRQGSVGEEAAASPPRAREPRSLWLRMLRQQRSHWLLLLAFAELGLLTLVATLAVGLSALAGVPAQLHAGSWIFVAFGWLGMIALGLYERHAEHSRDVGASMTTRILAALAVGAVVSLFAGWVAGAQGIVVSTIAMLAIAVVVILGSRLAFAKIARLPSLRRRTLFLGAGTRASQVAQRMRSPEEATISRSAQVIGFFPLESDEAALADRRRISTCDELSAFAFDHEVDEIVIVVDDRRRSLPLNELLRCKIAGVNVIDLDTFYERELGKTALELIQPSWCVFTRTFDTSAVREISKRGFDVGVSLLLIALLWPVMAMVALAILIEARGRGPVLYKQERVGRNGSDFRLLKFRSMRTDAEVDGIARFAQAVDCRVTHVGRLIRKTRLDELPQLWNVLRGDMSMVGPRPERPEFVARFNDRIPHYRLRHSVRPGLSGWAQLRFPYGASEEDAVEKLRYDLYYVKLQNLSFDASILMQTAEVIFFGRGAR